MDQRLSWVGIGGLGPLYTSAGAQCGWLPGWPSPTLSSYVLHTPAQYMTGSRTGASIAWLRPARRPRAWF